MPEKILKNAVRCKICGDVIESKHVHDFKRCSCGNVAVDGGHEYLRRCFAEPDDYEELSVCKEINNPDKPYEPDDGYDSLIPDNKRMITAKPDIRLQDFAMLVKNMRNKQKEYFKTRAKDTLIESKQLEAAVDKRIAELLKE